jgi:hypothetical protein
MAFIRTMFVGHGPSNLPEDRVVNVFHFATSADYTISLPLVETAVVEFYNTVAGSPAPAKAVGSYLSPWVQRAVELRSYDLEEVKPRTPTVLPFTLPAVEPGGGLPEEVAVVCTLHGTPPPAVGPRTRGRIYIGPLAMAAMQLGAATAPARPLPAFKDVLKFALERLVNNSPGWAIRSVTPVQNFVAIDQGYIDDAFDTQRRRGPRTTSRLLFGP